MISLLYVDDEPVLLEIVKLYLERSGQFSVESVTSATSALERLATGQYDAVVSDYQMPGMDGIALLKAVREEHGDLPFILFTGRGREEVVIQAINYGVDFYIQKGGDPKAQFAELAHKVRKAVSRRQMERALIESEKRLADIINFLPDATFAIDRSGHVIAWNRAIEEMTGIPADEMLGRGDFEYAIPFYGTRRKILIDLIFEPEDVIAEQYANITRVKDTLTADTSLPRPKGQPRTLMGMASPLYDRQGIIVGAIESIRDITDRKRIEMELQAACEQLVASQEALRLQYNELARNEQRIRESEKKYRDLADMLPQVVFEMDTDLILTYVNQHGIRTIGMTAEDLAGGISALSFLDPREHRRARIAIEKAAKDESDEEYEYLIARKDGSTFSALIYISPLFHSGGLEGFRGVLIDISGLKKTEEALRESEFKFRAIIDHSLQFIGLLAVDGTLIEANQAALAFVGASKSEVLRRPFWETPWWTHSAELQEKLKDAVSRAAAGETVQFQASHVGKDGSTVYTDFSLNPVVDAEGSTIYLIPEGRDVTRRVHAEKALRESEEKYRIFVETANEGIWAIDADFITTFVNRKMQDIFGYDEEEMIGHPVWDFVPPDDVESMKTTLFERRTGKLGRYERRWRKKDGSTVWCLTSATPLFSPDGKFRGSFGMFTDISEQKRVNEALHESEENYRSLVDLAPDAVLVHREGKIVFVNREGVRLSGAASADELIGKDIITFIHPDDRPVAREHLNQMSKDGITIPLHEQRLLRVDGHMFTAEVTAKPVLYETMPSVLSVFRDISDRKRMDNALHESMETLASIFRAAPIGIGLVSNRVIMKVNDRLCEMTGYTAEELVGKNARILYPTDEDYEYVGREKYDQIRRHGTGTVETRWQCKDGTIRTILLSSTPIDQADMSNRVTFTALDITDRTRAEEALRESEAKFRAIIDQSFQFIGLMNLDGILLVANRAALEFAGVSESDVKNQYFWDTPWWTHSPNLQERLKEGIQRAASGEIVRFEATHKAADGNLAYIDFSIKPVVDSKGEIIYLIPEGRDITERKYAEEALRESEEKYRTVVQQSQDGIFIAQDGLLVFHNTAFAAMSGYSAEELKRRSIAELIAPEDRELVLNRHRGRLKGEELPEVYEFSVLHHDGNTRIPVRMSIAAATFGGMPATIGTLHNISVDRERERILRESEERYRSVIENIHEGFIRGDEDGYLSLASPSAARLLGYDSVAEMIGMPMNSLYRYHERRQAMLDQMRTGGRVDNYEIEFLRKDGSSFWGSLDAHFIFHEGSEVGGTEAIIRDITDRKNMEETIRDVNRKLSLLNSITRHDVANKLTILQGFVQIAAMKNPEPVIREYLSKIETTAKEISNYIEFTRMYQELGVQAPSWFNVGEVVKKTPLSQVNCADMCHMYEIFADPMLERVFLNLFDNAIRHGERVTRITVSCNQSHTDLVIVIQDDGKGISPEEKTKIFLRGYGKNHGFGLFLAKEILALTGISIEETGTFGKGARFEMCVPEGKFRIALPNKSSAGR